MLQARTQLAATASSPTSSLFILLSLCLHLFLERLWLFPCLDRPVVLPNSSAVYGICALVYAAHTSSSSLDSEKTPFKDE